MKLIHRNFKILLLFISISWIVLAIFFGFCDLQISKFIADQESIAGIIGRDFGEAPGFGLIGISIAILIGKNFQNLKKQKIGVIVPLIIGIIYLSIGINSISIKSIIDSLGIIISLILFLFLTWNKDLKEYKTYAWITFIITILNVLLFVQIFKITWGRVRFRDLSANCENYTPWFIPRGPTGNKSFPSGHAAISFITIPLILIIRKIDFKKAYKTILSWIIIGWALFVAISRILIGAHYASDVLFSAEMSLLLTILLIKYLYKNQY